MEAAGGPSFLLGFFFSVPKPWVPRPCVFCKGGYDAADIIWFIMPIGLHRNAATTAAHHQVPSAGPSPAQFVCRRRAAQGILAGALLRLQCVDNEEAR